MKEKIEFGTKFVRHQGLPLNVVFLCETRHGKVVFGTANGGSITMSQDEFYGELESGKIEKAGAK